jgi:hypothetical protein
MYKSNIFVWDFQNYTEVLFTKLNSVLDIVFIYIISCHTYIYISDQFGVAAIRQFLGSEGTRQRSWLRHYATSWMVAGSIPDKFIGFFS